MMNQNLTFEKLLDWVEGHLAEPQVAHTTAAAVHDEAAQEIVEWIRLFEQVSEELVLVEPPTSVHHDLEQLFPAIPEAEDAAREPIPA